MDRGAWQARVEHNGVTNTHFLPLVNLTAPCTSAAFWEEWYASVLPRYLPAPHVVSPSGHLIMTPPALSAGPTLPPSGSASPSFTSRISMDSSRKNPPLHPRDSSCRISLPFPTQNSHKVGHEKAQQCLPQVKLV